MCFQKIWTLPCGSLDFLVFLIRAERLKGGDILAVLPKEFFKLYNVLCIFKLYNVLCISNHTFESNIGGQIKEAEELWLTATSLAVARCIHWEAPASFRIGRRCAGLRHFPKR